MRSGCAAAINERRSARLSRMTPEERVSLAVRLGEEALAALMAAHNLDRAAAIARVQATRRLGRRRSASADPDAP